MNQILVEGGFAPEWIMLKRDIIEQQDGLRNDLKSKCEELLINYKEGANNFKSKDLGKCHCASLNPKQDWDKYCERIAQENETLKLLNKNIDKFNLIVPMMKSQMFHFDLKKESDSVFAICAAKIEQSNKNDISSNSNETNNISISWTDGNSDIKGPRVVLDILLKNILSFVKYKTKGDA